MQVVLAHSSGENSQQIAFFLGFKENFLNVKKKRDHISSEPALYTEYIYSDLFVC